MRVPTSVPDLCSSISSSCIFASITIKIVSAAKSFPIPPTYLSSEPGRPMWRPAAQAATMNSISSAGCASPFAHDISIDTRYQLNDQANIPFSRYDATDETRRALERALSKLDELRDLHRSRVQRKPTRHAVRHRLISNMLDEQSFTACVRPSPRSSKQTFKLSNKQFESLAHE